VAKKAAARTKTKVSGPKRVQVLVAPDANTPHYYFNFVEISHSLHDFTLNVARIPSKLTREQNDQMKAGEAVAVEPTLQLVMSPSMLPALISALQVQRQAYESGFGPITTGEVEVKEKM
jgi:hypothetical protein